MISPRDLPDPLVVLAMSDDPIRIDEIAAVAPGRVEVHLEPPAAFEDKAGMYPPPSGLKTFRQPWHTDLSPAECAELRRRTHVLACGLPYPLRLRDRMPNLLWAEYTWAGVSDFMHSDLWDAGVVITSGRGVVQALPIAEMVIAASLSFAKQLGVAQRQTEAGSLDVSAYHLKLLAGKTMGIIGLGGIGLEIARLARALGMRVVASRRSAVSRQSNVDGVDVLYPSGQLPAMLAQADYVAISAPLTPETEGLIGNDAFASMKDGAYLLNIARGEVVDEAALKAALRSGKLGGAYLDVYAGERTRQPDQELMAFPNVVITPHLSGETDVDHWPMTEQIADQVRRFLSGEPLLNEVDFARGY